MKTADQQPLMITNIRHAEINGWRYLIVDVVGPQRLFFGKERGELTFFDGGYKRRTTRGKGITPLESIDYMRMVDNDGPFEPQPAIKSAIDSTADATLHRIGITGSRELALAIWQFLAEIGFPLEQGITS